MNYKFISYLILFFFISPFSYAEIFKSNFISFELPGNWQCNIKKATWNCHSKAEKKNHPAIIVFVAKEAGPQDQLSLYKGKLSGKPGLQSSNNRFKKIKNILVKENIINGQKWVDGLTYNREAPDYYTRYLATVKDKVALLITFSSHKSKYTNYLSEFNQAVQSLKVLNPTEQNNLQTENSQINANSQNSQTNELFDEEADFFEEDEDSEAQSNNLSWINKNTILMTAGALILLIIFALK